MGRNVVWVMYADDVLVIIPKNSNIDNKLRLLNNVHPKIQFTVEKENNGNIAFLDVMIKRTNLGPKFSVYRKPTNKNDFIHSLSAHTDRTKSGVIIGFFLRAIRICSPEFLQNEYKYIVNSFQELGYPKGLILKLKQKAIKIMERKEEGNGVDPGINPEINPRVIPEVDPRVAPEANPKPRYLIIPHSQENEIIQMSLRTSKTQVVFASNVKISEITKNAKKSVNDLSIVHRISCDSCHKKYFGESSRGLEKRLKEHKMDVRYHRISNALVQHIDECNHLPNWNRAEVIHSGISKPLRKSLEAMHIVLEDSTNGRAGFINWSKTAADIARRDWIYKKRGRSQPG